ncbi:LOW QUALITY PROTEIN: hypothetical protein HID58_046024 [Brassica napus]|uniref:Uncharacterized protein n=1 Tax=Brassica napus TaxID=3708 RepID=A0ABQ8AV97_BRANA|nr:LOW QUALITY PROTEIN: hypothetical protein HID58_046024 [Brassica napus]
MAEIEVPVYCYWNGCIKYGPEGVYYEGGSTPKKIIVHPKIALNRLLDEMYMLTGVDVVDKQRSKVKIFVVGKSTFQYLLLPVMNNHSLETMLGVPSKHPSIKMSNCIWKSNLMELLILLPVPRNDRGLIYLLKRDNSNMMTEDKADAVALVTGDTINSHKDLEKYSGSGVLKPCISSLWLDDHDLRVGLCFKDVDELKKAIVKYTGPHTCYLKNPEDFESEFDADEFERVVRVHPTKSFAELKKWWKDKSGYLLEDKDVREVKEEAIKTVFGDWDQKICPTLQTFDRSWYQRVERKVKGKYKLKLKLMIASGLDAANHFLPLAFAVTKKVSSDSWRWFLSGIREKVVDMKQN